MARDLRAAPFNLRQPDAPSSSANKLFYQGSGNIGAWHACNCGGTSDGCGATNGYMQWLAADDDNGNLNDGTPHMTAIFAAFNRHGIACATPTPVNSGCASGPTAAPTLTVTARRLRELGLSWNAVPAPPATGCSAAEGFAGCNFGKARDRHRHRAPATRTPRWPTAGQYCYNVVAAGSNAACFGPASNCACVQPACAAPSGTPALAGPNDGSSDVEFLTPLDWSDVEATKYEVQVATDANFTTIVRTARSLTASDWTVTPACRPTTTYYWRVRAVTSCGGASPWTAPALVHHARPASRWRRRPSPRRWMGPRAWPRRPRWTGTTCRWRPAYDVQVSLDSPSPTWSPRATD